MATEIFKKVMKKNMFQFKVKKILIPALLCIPLIFLRTPTIFEPHWSKEEGFFSVIAHLVNKDYLLYKDLSFTKMPGIILIYSIGEIAGPLSLAVVKIVGIIAAATATFFNYKITEKLFSKQASIISSFLMIVFLGLTILDANVISVTLICLPFLLGGIYFTISPQKKIKQFIGFLLLGLGFLFDLKLIVIILLIFYFKRRISKNKKVATSTFSEGIFTILITCIPFFSYLIFSTINKSQSYFVTQAIINRISEILYTDSYRLPVLGISYTVILYIAFAFLALYTLHYYLSVKELSENTYFVLTWGVLAIFSVLASSEYNLYNFIYLVPAFSIIASILIIDYFSGRKKQIVMTNIVVFILSVFCISNLVLKGNSYSPQNRPVSYYENFFRYITKDKDISSYVHEFNNATYSLYTLDTFLTQNFYQEKVMFTWIDNPWIYKLTDKYPQLSYFECTEDNKKVEKIIDELQENESPLIIVDINRTIPIMLLDYIEEYEYKEETSIDNYIVYTKDID